MQVALSFVSAYLSFALLILPLRQQSVSTSSVAVRNDQALSILRQAQDAAGGVSSLGSISDYTASGTVTFHWAGNDVRGTVTVLGRKSNQFRMDAVLPSGVHSWVRSTGKAREKTEDGTISEIVGFSTLSPASLINPYLQLAEASRGRSLTVEYKGQINVDGNPAYDIQIKRTVTRPDGTVEPIEISALDVLIDASSFRILLTRDMARPSRNSAEGPPHELRYSDYRPINSVLVPFSITETVGGQETWRIQLDRVGFNSGLSDSNFTL